MKNFYLIIRFFIPYLLGLFLLLDLAYSGLQYNRNVLDGDMIESIVPAPSMEKLMTDPLGVKTIINNDYHIGSNRFFAHWIFQKVFRGLPIALQTFLDPIDSVYASCAISKLLIHFVLIVFLYMAISGHVTIFTKRFLLIAALLTPLFQTNSYFVRLMGIIDPSITYSFFYALPIIYLILYFLPLIFEFYHGKPIKINLLKIVLWVLLAFLVCFSGPLNPGIVLVSVIILIISNLYKNWRSITDVSLGRKICQSVKLIPSRYYLFLLPISLMSLYSLYLGSYNAASVDPMSDLSILDLYAKLPMGMFKTFISIPWLLLIAFITINFIILRKRFKDSVEYQKFVSTLYWILAFTILYILLLPFGGYRSYRPFIIRYDTILPITLLAVFLWTYTSSFLIAYFIKHNKIKNLLAYGSLIVLFLGYFTLIDLSRTRHNECEKASLEVIAASTEDVIRLDNNCTVVSWLPFYTPEEGDYPGRLLYIWRITDKPKKYYNASEFKE